MQPSGVKRKLPAGDSSPTGSPKSDIENEDSAIEIGTGGFPNNFRDALCGRTVGFVRAAKEGVSSFCLRGPARLSPWTWTSERSTETVT